MNALREKFLMLLAETQTDYIRDLHRAIAWDEQLIAIIGARGVGKTTLVLQHIKLHEDIETSLFVYADDMWFATHTLIELADRFYKEGGKALYIDEIHKYKNWSREIKNIYDSYKGLRVCYTGSSILDLQKGGHDLSRRLLEYKMHGLSFREYLAIGHGITLPVHTLEQILENKIEFPYTDYRPIALFKEYLKSGYYPYFKKTGYNLRLNKVINRVIEEDIPRFAELSVTMAEKLKVLLYIISQSVPFKPNYSKLSRELGIHRNYVSDLVYWLERAGLINILRDETKGIKLLGKVNKIYMNNPNLAYVLSDTGPNIGNIRETVFLSWLNVTHSITSSSVSDFKIDKYTFEIGGKSKGKTQIENVENAFLVKDDIEYGYMQSVPLWAFGLLY